VTRIRYWLVNKGTTQDPWISRPVGRYREWHATEGDVHGFSRRPSSIAIGDVLIHRAVGSPGDRIVAAAEVVGPPKARKGRWPWRLPRRLTYVCSSIERAPTAAELGIAARGLRTYRELDADVGARAVKRLRETGQRFS
jgi:hypothetical protein